MLRSFGLVALTTIAIFQQPTPYRPVATNLEVMKSMVIPASDALFAADPDALKTDEQWSTLETNALILAESGNLLMMDGRSKEGTWAKESRALVDAGALALDAVRAKNADRVLEVGDQILNACSGCHNVYLSK